MFGLKKCVGVLWRAQEKGQVIFRSPEAQYRNANNKVLARLEIERNG